MYSLYFVSFFVVMVWFGTNTLTALVIDVYEVAGTRKQVGPPTTDHQPLTHQTPTTDHQPPTTDHQRPSTNDNPPTMYSSPPTAHRPPPTPNLPPTPLNFRPPVLPAES